MRSINKLTEPNILKSNARLWKEALLSELGTSSNFNDLAEGRISYYRGLYRKKEIKDTLRSEALGKCGYCETEIASTQPGDIDHIRPTSKFASGAYVWRNLVFSCRICNKEKSDYFEKGKPLLNPFTDDPNLHIRLTIDGSIEPITLKGFRTACEVKLDRSALIERRCEAVADITSLVELHNKLPRKKAKAGIVCAIELMLSPTRSYSDLLRQWVNSVLK